MFDIPAVLPNGAGPTAPAFTHEALPYDGPGRFVGACGDVVRDGLRAGDRLIVLAPDARLDDVRDDLGDDAGEVAFVATDEHGRNPGRITTLLDSFQSAGDGRHSTGLHAATLIDRNTASRSEVWLADHLLNHPDLASWPLRVVCLFDTDELDTDGHADMCRAHAVVRGLDENPDYDAGAAGRTYAVALEEPPATSERRDIAGADLAALRGLVRDQAVAFALAPERADDLVLAVNEIVTNSLRYGGGRAGVAVWFADGAVVCDVRDRGHITDQLAGRFAPPPAAASGRGLWLANHLCDLVQVRSSPDGTVVRMHVDV